VQAFRLAEASTDRRSFGGGWAGLPTAQN